MKYSIIIPCYNEINTIDKVIDRISESGICDYEIIVVDDCSVDGTSELIQRNLKKRIHQPRYLLDGTSHNL